jgi:excisionase family DNA binding protein
MKYRKSSGSSGFGTLGTEPIIEEDRLLTAVEAAHFLNLNLGTIYHMVSEKRLPVVRLSARCIRFSRRAVLNWVESLTQKARRCPEDLQRRRLRRNRSLEEI